MNYSAIRSLEKSKGRLSNPLFVIIDMVTPGTKEFFIALIGIGITIMSFIATSKGITYLATASETPKLLLLKSIAGGVIVVVGIVLTIGVVFNIQKLKIKKIEAEIDKLKKQSKVMDSSTVHDKRIERRERKSTGSPRRSAS